MCLFVHVHGKGTTGMHARERRRHQYAARCAQCGCELDETHRVASHVVTYPCFPCNPCVGVWTLKTCCKACNAKHTARPDDVDAIVMCAPRSSRFYSCRTGTRLLSNPIAWPFFWRRTWRTR